MMYYSAAWYVYCRDQFKSINECRTNPNESPRPCRVPKFEVTTRVSTHSVTGTGSGSRENTLAKTFQSTRCFTSPCSFKVHKTFPRITVNKLPRLPPASISYSSAIRDFYEKILAKNSSTPKFSNGRRHVFNSYVTNRM